ncbi:MAG: DNA mismatch repair endonuclease MutL [Candidatus Omnitrophica bacterium]|nr:DNA mismatch repair endonuclease MutL [Candidatus Omnitrophota bacterium]
MSRIKVLSDVVISQIAAGEVVQRPASVVKELIDNSLDAGAGRISVEVDQGGNDRIQVTDDGCGMSREELPLAVHRHATSKIELESDLQTIRTHGFRGEALAAISSVSKVEIVSRTHGERQGHKLTIEGGEHVSLGPTGAAPGTSVRVSELFYNTPARRKFMKTATTEFDRVGQVVTRAAMMFPGIHFELSHNDRRTRNYTPAPSAADRLVQILGTETVEDLLPVDFANEDIQIEGFTSRPTTHRKTAGDLYFFVNQRFIRDKILMRSLSEAYRASLPQRRYPVTVLFITLDPAMIDVNVHPSKEEIRFLNEGMIWKAVYAGIRESLTGMSGGGYRPTAPDQEPARSPILNAPKKEPAAESVSSFNSASSTPFPEQVKEASEVALPVREEPVFEPRRESPSAEPLSSPGVHDLRASIEKLNRLPVTQPVRADTEIDLEDLESRDWKAVAQVFESFILCEAEGEMTLFDQHALHERIQFEKLRKQHEEGGVSQQSLMFPMTFEVPSHQVPLMTDSIPLLSELGFEIDPFGEKTFAVRSIPSDLKMEEVEGVLRDALLDLSDQGMVSPLSDRAEKVIARMSCRSAIKANESLSLNQMQNLIDQYSSNPILSTCPHGRPPIWRISRRELEKMFDRP